MKSALIGCGYWGTAIARTTAELDDLEITTVHDIDIAAAESTARRYGARTTHSVAEALDGDVGATLIATPADTHYDLARRSLLAGKHVFVEKPFTTDFEQARELVCLADELGLVCMVDHISLYSEPIRRLKVMIDAGELGPVVYVTCRRVNRGVPRYYTDVIWDLAVHDLSIIDYLVGLDVESTSVSSVKYDGYPYDLLANITLDLTSGVHAQVSVCSLSPVKVREVVVVGTERMAVVDDTKVDKLRIHDQGAVYLREPGTDGSPEQPRGTADGHRRVAAPESRRPLTVALAHFAECARSGREPLTGGRSILRVMRALETISKKR